MGIPILLAGLALGVWVVALFNGLIRLRNTLDPDGTIFVTETIDVDFGEFERHGIFRTIPVSYITAGLFHSRSLVSGLGRSMHSMGSTLTSAPRPSGGGIEISFGGGGGSSGFGSGGGSGGGFGGGGGGSW